MVKSIRDYGTGSTNPTELMDYNIELKWDEGDKEYMETFTGTDVNDVLQKAMKFIIKHYNQTP